MPRDPLILIVDDTSDAREIFEQYLAFKGYRVLVAKSGAEAVATARASHPDLILMDIRMPEMTGTEAMKLRRRDPAHSKTPIVALTAHALVDERAAALAAGFDEVITKPVDLDALVVAVQRLVSRTPETN